MQIRDKEQERKDYENSPEGRRKSLIVKVIFVVAVVACMAVIYVTSHNPAFTGTPHVVVVDGVEIIPGETTGAQLYEAGFQIADRSMYSVDLTAQGAVSGYKSFLPLDTEAEKETYYYGLSLIKEGKSYATLQMINEASSTKTLGEMKVREIIVYGSSENAENASLEGIPVSALTKAALTEKAGEPEREETIPEDEEEHTQIRWAKGNYKMELVLNEDGTCYSFGSFYERQ